MKAAILVVGPTPPPYHGVSMAMQSLLTSSLTEQYKLIHLDITDRRGIAHVDKPDLHDVVSFIRQFVKCTRLMVSERPSLFYIPISQTRIGFLRDTLFILPAFATRCPVIIHLHGGSFDTLYTECGMWWKAVIDFVLRRVSRFIVLGEALKPIFLTWANSDRILVVPNGVVRSLSVVATEADEGRRFRVLFLSTLSEQKGLFVLLQAAEYVTREWKDIEFWIAGPWYNETARQHAEQLIAESGLKNYIKFLGEVSGQQKQAFFSGGDLFVFSGLQQEGQPLTVLEAMSAGLPVIATDRGCLRETIVEGVTGFVVPPGEPRIIGDRLLELIRQPEIRRQMGRMARQRFEREYTMELFIARMTQVFANTLAAAAPQSVGIHQIRSGIS